MRASFAASVASVAAVAADALQERKKYRLVEEALLLRFGVALAKNALKLHGAALETEPPSGASEADLRAGIISRYPAAAIKGILQEEEDEDAAAAPAAASHLAKRTAMPSPIKRESFSSMPPLSQGLSGLLGVPYASQKGRAAAGAAAATAGSSSEAMLSIGQDIASSLRKIAGVLANANPAQVRSALGVLAEDNAFEYEPERTDERSERGDTDDEEQQPAAAGGVKKKPIDAETISSGDDDEKQKKEQDKPAAAADAQKKAREVRAAKRKVRTHALHTLRGGRGTSHLFAVISGT